MNIRRVSTVLLIACVCGLHAQDPLISIKSAAPLHFNPAYTGNEYYARASLDYRNHYPATGMSFITYAASFDIFLDKYNSGFGIMLTADQLGSKSFSYNSASITYSYKANINETNALRAGISGNLFYGVNNPNGLTFPDMINLDGTVNQNDLTYERTSSFGADFGAGLLFENKRFEAGVALFHLGSPGDVVYWHRPIRIHAHIEMKIPLFARKTYRPQSEIESIIKGSTSLTPCVRYLRQGRDELWSAGALFQISAFKFGLYSRQDFRFRSFTFSAQAGYSADIMEVGYMCDFGFIGNTFRGLSTASHELCVIFKFPSSKEY